MKKIIIILWLGFLSQQAIAQKITTESASLENGKITVVFTINDLGNKKITTKLYTSIDNYKNPVKELSGNIGTDISEGKNTVYWDYKKEGLALSDGIEFKVIPEEVKPKYSSIFTHNAKYFEVPGFISQKYINEIVWRSNDLSKDVIIELHLEGKKIMMLDIIKNIGEYQWQLAPAIKANLNRYKLKIVNHEDPTDYIMSNDFFVFKRGKSNSSVDFKHRFKVVTSTNDDGETIIDWTGALYAEEYKISLYLRPEFSRLIGISNESNIPWAQPSGMTGKYQIKVEDTKNTSNYIIGEYIGIDKSGKIKIIEDKSFSGNEIKVNESFNRGSAVLVIFDDEVKSKYVIIELHQYERLIKKLDIVENNGHYKWVIPESEDKGKYYQLKIIDKDNPDNYIYTSVFKIEK